MSSIRTKRNSGFTLLEIIAAIAISSVLSVMIIQIAMNNTTRSYLPLAQLTQELALQEVMEEITADYRLLLNTHVAPLVELQSRIKSGHYWTTKSYAADITLNKCYCFEFAKNAGTNWQEGVNLGDFADCLADDNNLKVALSYRNPATRSLTAVFSR